MCGCNSPRKPKTVIPNSFLSSSGNFSQPSVVLDGENKSSMVMVEYVGPILETFSIRSRVSRDVSYRFGNNDQHRTKAVFLGDAEWMIGVTDREAKPTYMVLSNMPSGDVEAPAAFIGQQITA